MVQSKKVIDNMQISRLFEIVYILLSQKTVTAKQMAEHFGVSVRTIYRDVETLSGAGIPVYMIKGKGGGISLLDNFVLNKSMLTENEQNEILSALKGLSALSMPEADSILNKLGTVFNKSVANWIDIDFSYWGSGAEEKEKFNVLKSAILSKRIISFDYYAPGKDRSMRIAEPLQVYFKERAWYLRAYCLDKHDLRTFKIIRMRNVEVTEHTFNRELPDKKPDENFFMDIGPISTITLKFFRTAWGRVFDELDLESIIEEDDESITIEAIFPDEDWVFSYIVSFGTSVQILEPEHIKQMFLERLKENLDFHKSY